jgi:SAM-dependent methyltransferase
MESTRCNLCDADDYARLLDAAGRSGSSEETFQIVRCKNCGLVYLNPRPEEEAILGFYPEDYHRRSFSLEELDAQRLFGLPWRDAIQRKYAPLLRLKSSGRVLDVGCGDGFLLKYLQEEGWDVMGTEPGNSACAREILGLDVFQGPLDAADFSAGSFDVITLSHVLEHLHDPVATLQRVRHLLRDGGLVHIEVPNFDCLEARLFDAAWIGIAAPLHLYHFTPNTLRATAEKVKLDIVESGFVSPSPNESASFSESLRFFLADRGWYRRGGTSSCGSTNEVPGGANAVRWRTLRRLLHGSEAKAFYALSLLMNKVGRGSNIYVTASKQGAAK